MVQPGTRGASLVQLRHLREDQTEKDESLNLNSDDSHWNTGCGRMSREKTRHPEISRGSRRVDSATSSTLLAR